MKIILTGAQVYTKNGLKRADVLLDEGRIISISPTVPPVAGAVPFQLNDGVIFPGFVDVHVHLREPGFSYKETIGTGTRAAARGGYTTVCTMPNLNPTPDTPAHLREQLDLIRRDAVIRVCPYGTITMGEQGETLSDMEELAPDVVAFSDDGHGVQSGERMEAAMKKAASLGKILAAHCEDNSLLKGGYIHDGDYARAHGHKGISAESEWRQIARDLELAKKTGCRYHVCHVSTRESVELIRKAKADGVDVTCETAPHYLTLCDRDLQEDGRFKMNPPLRSPEDWQALIEGLLDGTIDMIATDHAPHSAEEKSKGLAGSLMGVVGLETAFPVLYTNLVMPGILSLDKLLELLHTNPARRFGVGTPLEEGQPADLTVFDLNRAYAVDPEEFQTKGRSTPFAGWKVYGRCLLTVSNGSIAWQEAAQVPPEMTD